MPVDPPISSALRSARQAVGLSQSAPAARMGTTQSAIARAESETAPAHTLAFLERFATATGRALVAHVLPDRPEPPSIDELRRLGRRIGEAAAAQGIRRVRVVGSVARGTARPDSDVDLLVTTEPSLIGGRYFAALDEFQVACTRILRRSVDVIDEASVQSPRALQRLLREARSL